jgi:hypothetical protein
MRTPRDVQHLALAHDQLFAVDGNRSALAGCRFHARSRRMDNERATLEIDLGEHLALAGDDLSRSSQTFSSAIVPKIMHGGAAAATRV